MKEEDLIELGGSQDQEASCGRDSELLTASRSARYLGIAVGTLYNYARSGRIGVVRFGQRMRFRQGDLDRFIERHLVPAEEVDP